MALTSIVVIRQILVLEDGRIEIQRVRRIIDDDGVTIIAEAIIRILLEPGDDVSAVPPRIRRIAAAVWDAATVQAYRDAKAQSVI